MILHTPHYPINKSIPGFSVFRGHKRIESVNRYHMEIASMNIEKAMRGEPTITKHEIAYTRVYDNVRLPEDPAIKNLTVAISFQEHTYGNFAVIRNALEKPKTEKETSERSDKDAILSYHGDSKQLPPIFGFKKVAAYNELKGKQNDNS